jgi:tartrate dehydratase beta subunit/fumarate hydratase class I family protein
VAFPLKLPLDHQTIIEHLTVGTRVAITGTIISASPEANRQLATGARLPEDTPEGTLLLHCRPHLKRRGSKWDAVSIEPEISAAHEASVAGWLSHRQVRGFIGYGGFGDDAFQHFRRFTGCYLQTYAGAGPALAEHVKNARELRFGEGLKGSDAVWMLDVEDFPAIVTMGLEGGNFQRMMQNGTAQRLKTLSV